MYAEIDKKYNYIATVLKSCKNQEQVDNVMRWEESIRNLMKREYGITELIVSILESKNQELNKIKTMVQARFGSYFESPYNDEKEPQEEEFVVNLTLNGSIIPTYDKHQEVRSMFNKFIEQLKEQGIEVEYFDVE